MALYSYKRENRIVKRTANILSYGALIIGSLLLFWAFYPIISFEIYSRVFLTNKITQPVPDTNIASSLQIAHTVLGAESNGYTENLKDFTQASLWFPTSNTRVSDQVKTKINTVREYTMSIPKLNIQSARVQVGGDDLTKGLVHYAPASLPGEGGNVVVFGHSTLPQLYDVKDYKTIFTYLPSLNKGDHIISTVDGTNYEYEIYDMFVVKPDQISVLNQDYSDSQLTLITCVPPGTYWNRLVVKARLTKVPSQL